jgi:hydrogenase maturation protein HypF
MSLAAACRIRVRGVVQGVGFRPFVFRLAREHGLAGWVLNGEDGVEIHIEGTPAALRGFVRQLEQAPPPAAVIAAIEQSEAAALGLSAFTIRDSRRSAPPSTRISPDLPVCDECLRELFDPGDRRHGYPYINCTNCGPRYSIVLRLPYDRPNTTMAGWPLDAGCSEEYHDPLDRRFHAQPIACSTCGPDYELRTDDRVVQGASESIRSTADLLRRGGIVAVKGLGGYHLACDACAKDAVWGLRERKYRKEKPFALMVRDLETARALVEMDLAAERLLTAPARPVLLARARRRLAGVAPDTDELGVMLPYTPLHHLLFAAGAPAALVMTSANRSSEPMAYQDEPAIAELTGLADAFLIGARPIARRVDDSVVRSGAAGAVILRRARGYAPGVVATLPSDRPILALGGDLKSAITLVVSGEAIVSQHIGDLEHYEARRAFTETVTDLLSMYDVPARELLIVHDAHPEYVSTQIGREWPAAEARAVQHHRAHVASVVAERQAWDAVVVGAVFDGTGYGDDGAIWGGELFTGSVREGFERAGRLRQAALVGGDAAARHPVQAAAGFLAQIDDLPELVAPPFEFPDRYARSREALARGVRTFRTTSVGRLFDAAAALLGFTRSITFEGQAAMWLEQLAGREVSAAPYPFPFEGDELDFRPLLHAVAADRHRGLDVSTIARRFHAGLARGLVDAVAGLAARRGTSIVVCSGGVFQNTRLRDDVERLGKGRGLHVWTNHAVPPNDGGISLGQAALAVFGRFDRDLSSGARRARDERPELTGAHAASGG